AKPLAGQLAAQAFLPAGLMDERAGSRELDTDADVALVIDDLSITGPAGMIPDEDLPQLTDFVPTDRSLVDQVQQFALLVCNRSLLVVENDEIAANHRCGIRFAAPVNAVGVGDGCYKLSWFKPVTVEHRLAGIRGAHDDIRAIYHSLGV